MTRTDRASWERFYEGDPIRHLRDPMRKGRIKTLALICSGRTVDIGGGACFIAAARAALAAEQRNPPPPPTVTLEISAAALKGVASAFKEVGAEGAYEGTVLARAARLCVVGDAQNLPFKDNSFQTAVLGEVLEHYSKEEAVWILLEAARVAERFVVISVPNQKLPPPKAPAPGEPPLDSSYHHQQEYSLEKLKDQTEAIGRLVGYQLGHWIIAQVAIDKARAKGWRELMEVRRRTCQKHLKDKCAK